MKKIWALERHYTKEENLDLLNSLLSTIETAEIENKDKMMADIRKKIEEVTDTWSMVFSSNNYYTFCGKVKSFLSQKDDEAIKELKDRIGKVPFSPEINAQYRETHNVVKNTYRVVEAEVGDDWKNDNLSKDYKVTKVNDGVYRFLWGSMSQYKGKSR